MGVWREVAATLWPDEIMHRRKTGRQPDAEEGHCQQRGHLCLYRSRTIRAATRAACLALFQESAAPVAAAEEEEVAAKEEVTEPEPSPEQ